MIDNKFTRFLHRILSWFLRRKTDDPDEPQLDLADLHHGDILLMSGKSLISDLIRLLTDGNSHSAITYSPPHTLVHEVPKHATFARMEKKSSGLDITVMRPRAAVSKETTQRILGIANDFVEKKEPYPMSTIYLLGMILIYRRVSPNTVVQKYVVRILRKVVAEIEDYIAQRKTPGKLPMVCSQFVHHCYEAGGVPLPIRNGVILMAAQAAGAPADPGSLLDAVAAQPESTKLAAFEPQMLAASIDDTDELDDDELLRNLHAALQADSDEAGSEVIPELTQEVHRLAEVIQSAREDRDEPGLLMAAGERLDISTRGLQFLRDNKSLFVTPADLQLHCDALEKIGEIKNVDVQEPEED